MTRKLSLALLLTALALGALTVPAAAKTCGVSKFRYSNNGSYTASDLTIFTSTDIRDNREGSLTEGQSKTLPLENTKDLTQGQEVWLRYRISAPPFTTTPYKRDCRKNGTKLVYDPEGNTWEYFSKGAIKTNNRCRFANNTCKVPSFPVPETRSTRSRHN